MQFTKLLKNTFLFLAVSVLAFDYGISAMAQNNPNNPGGGGVGIPVSASTIPVASPTFGIDMTTCGAEFDWEKFIQNNKNGIEGSTPYIQQDCVVQKGVIVDETIKVSRYADFTVGSAATKAWFGDMPVVGVFPNQGYTAQGIVDKNIQQINTNFNNVDRSKISSLTNIFTQNHLNEIFSTTNGQFSTGMPRIYSTGTDTFIGGLYQGGWCKVENGQLKVRTDWAGKPVDPSLYGRDISAPLTSCARQGESQVEDRNLQVYQFLWTIPYPTAAQCQQWWGVDADTCNVFYQNSLGRNLAGDTSMTNGSKLVYTFTFYGSYDDQYTKWVRWATPDIGNRANATKGFIRSYDGYIAYEM